MVGLVVDGHESRGTHLKREQQSEQPNLLFF